MNGSDAAENRLASTKTGTMVLPYSRDTLERRSLTRRQHTQGRGISWVLPIDDPIADGDDDVEAIERDGAVGRSNMQNLHIALLGDLTLTEFLQKIRSGQPKQQAQALFDLHHDPRGDPAPGIADQAVARYRPDLVGHRPGLLANAAVLRSDPNVPGDATAHRRERHDDHQPRSAAVEAVVRDDDAGSRPGLLGATRRVEIHDPDFPAQCRHLRVAQAVAKGRLPRAAVVELGGPNRLQTPVMCHDVVLVRPVPGALPRAPCRAPCPVLRAGISPPAVADRVPGRQCLGSAP